MNNRPYSLQQILRVTTVLVFVCISAWIIFKSDSYGLKTTMQAVQVTPQADISLTGSTLARGYYLSQAGNCTGCHTGPGKALFSGGLPMKTPFGTIISTNITPDSNTGIGSYTEFDFARALREGIAKDGRHLYPAMPYPSYSRITDDDVHALYIYFQTGVKPVAQKTESTDLAWPFSMRGLMVIWNWFYLDKRVFDADTTRSIEWNRGAYLVQGLGHCGDCHTPRSITGGVKASSDRDGSAFLSGATLNGWYAQPLRHISTQNVAQWSSEDIVRYLKTGRTNQTAAFGPMVRVVENSTQYLTTQDLTAIAIYIQSLGAVEGNVVAASSARTPIVADNNHSDAEALRNGIVKNNHGAMVYLNNCNACHRSSGMGADQTFPALAGSSVVNARDPTSLIRLVLIGSAMPSTVQAPSAIAMPDFSWRLTDTDVAEVLSFVRLSWGNQAGLVTPAQVTKVRESLTLIVTEVF